ncbi:acyl-CoA thioesterase [Mycolicibacterium komossense]|uniref:Thioesterase family protein n=1 Tax=Mycolicibacterium komossense TaxID=1779 RepID=A0ABT3CA95_9MYCO|nr:acyl-CoA thioesterase domain-containing protein [Mycolicibacterium komossense]MCV7226323.1 thioesterase family protein [Mycolicibacterium komossense]
MESTLSAVLDSLDLDQVSTTPGSGMFVGKQFDGPAHHILGAHIAAQALMAGARTAGGRAPHSMHVYFLRPGDGRYPVDFEVAPLQDGRTFAARRVTGRQNATVLMEATTSFSSAVQDIEYQPSMPVVAEPESLASIPAHGTWTSLDWFERRNVTTAEGAAQSRMWLRPRGDIPDDPVLADCLAAYLSAVTLIEPTLVPRWKTMAGPPISAMRGHSVWFHRPPRMSDWLFYDESSPSATAGRSLATGTMFNRNGELVCTATQEIYFPPKRE